MNSVILEGVKQGAKTRLLTKTRTEKNIVETKEGFIPFEAYRARLLGKRYISYSGNTDLILEVYRNSFGMFEYKVQEEKTKEIRIHGTTISLKKVF